MMKITGLSHIFKWDNLHNWWLTKYFFAPLYVVLILASAQAIKLIEDDSWLDHNDPPHSYATNMWWRLANNTVKTSDMEDNDADGPS